MQQGPLQQVRHLRFLSQLEGEVQGTQALQVTSQVELGLEDCLKIRSQHR